MRLVAIAANGEVIPPFEIPVVMPVVQDIFAVPSHIQFGELQVGATASQVVLLASRTNRPFNAVGVEVPPSTGIAVRAVDATVEGTTGFRVQQTGVALGDRQHRLRFQVRRHDDEETLHVDVPISFYGRPRPELTH